MPVPALSDSPLSFVDGTGRQFQIALSRITFGRPVGQGQGAVNIDPSSVPSNLLQSVSDFATSLVRQGLMQPGTAPRAFPVLTVIAREPGSTGNSIGITFLNPQPVASPPTVDVQVTVTEVYPRLTLSAAATAASSNILNVLGSATASGSRPGLLLVSGTPATAGVPETFVASLAGSSTLIFAAPLRVAPGSPATVAFSLVPRHGSASGPGSLSTDPADSALLGVSVGNQDTVAGTFDLTVTWQKNATSLPFQSLSAAASNPFGYVVQFAPPPGGAAIGATPPRAASFTLQAGRDATATTPSRAALAVASA